MTGCIQWHMHAFNSSSQEGNVGRSLSLRLDSPSEFQASQGYIGRPCLKNKKFKKICKQYG